MGTYYCVNRNSTQNPGWHHEVHTVSHADELGIANRISLGYHSDEIAAVQAAKAGAESGAPVSVQKSTL